MNPFALPTRPAAPALLCCVAVGLAGCGDRGEANARAEQGGPEASIRLAERPVVVFQPVKGHPSETNFAIFVRLNRVFPTRASTGGTRGFIELVGGMDDLGSGEVFAHSRRRHCYGTGWQPGPSLRRLRDGQVVRLRVMLRQPEMVIDVVDVRAQRVPSPRYTERYRRRLLRRLGCGTRVRL